MKAKTLQANPMEQTRAEVMYIFRFFRPIVSAMTFYESSEVGLDIPTLCVDKHLRVVYNAEWWANQTANGRIGALAHEAGHAVYRHGVRFAFGGGYDPYLWNVAGDLEINSGPGIWEYLQEIPGVLHPKDFGWAVGKAAEFYYPLCEQLPQPPEPPEPPGRGRGEGEGEDEDEDEENDSGHSRSNSRPHKPGGGDCGSIAHGQSDDRELPPPGKGGPPGMSEEQTRTAARKSMEEITKDVKARGSLGANVVRQCSEALQPPKVPWQSTLQGIIARAAEIAAKGDSDFRRVGEGRRSLSRDMPSKTWHDVVPTVAIIIDTSGSMSEKDLKAALSEVDGIMKTVRSQVLYLAFDAALGHAGRISNIHEVELRGGGGTKMEAAMVMAIDPDFCSSQGSPVPDVVVVLTDLGTHWPDIKEMRGIQTIIVGIGDEQMLARMKQGLPVPKWATYVEAVL